MWKDLQNPQSTYLKYIQIPHISVQSVSILKGHLGI